MKISKTSIFCGPVILNNSLQIFLESFSTLKTRHMLKDTFISLVLGFLSFLCCCRADAIVLVATAKLYFKENAGQLFHKIRLSGLSAGCKTVHIYSSSKLKKLSISLNSKLKKLSTTMHRCSNVSELLPPKLQQVEGFLVGLPAFNMQSVNFFPQNLNRWRASSLVYLHWTCNQFNSYFTLSGGHSKDTPLW